MPLQLIRGLLQQAWAPGTLYPSVPPSQHHCQHCCCCVCSVFGELKSLRIPKKLSGTGTHRGFGFADFLTKEDAKVSARVAHVSVSCAFDVFLATLHSKILFCSCSFSCTLFLQCFDTVGWATGRASGL